MLLDKIERNMHSKINDKILPKPKIMSYHDIISPIKKKSCRNNIDYWSRKKLGPIRFRIYDEPFD